MTTERQDRVRKYVQSQAALQAMRKREEDQRNPFEIQEQITMKTFLAAGKDLAKELYDEGFENDEILNFFERTSEQLNNLNDGKEEIIKMEEGLRKLCSKYDDIAIELSKKRELIIREFDKWLLDELNELKSLSTVTPVLDTPLIK